MKNPTTCAFDPTAPWSPRHDAGSLNCSTVFSDWWKFYRISMRWVNFRRLGTATCRYRNTVALPGGSRRRRLLRAGSRNATVRSSARSSTPSPLDIAAPPPWYGASDARAGWAVQAAREKWERRGAPIVSPAVGGERGGLRRAGVRETSGPACARPAPRNPRPAPRNPRPATLRTPPATRHPPQPPTVQPAIPHNPFAPHRPPRVPLPRVELAHNLRGPPAPGRWMKAKGSRSSGSCTSSDPPSARSPSGDAAGRPACVAQIPSFSATGTGARGPDPLPYDKEWNDDIR